MTEESVDSPPQAPGFQTLFNLDSWSPCFFFFPLSHSIQLPGSHSVLSPGKGASDLAKVSKQPLPPRPCLCLPDSFTKP